MSPKLTRRDLLQSGACGLGCLALARLARAEDQASSQVGVDDTGYPLIEARHYQKLDRLRVRCELCPRRCQVADLERGYCGVRENRGGTYHSLVHSRLVSMHTDPIEKKPFFHVVPGGLAFSVATTGCNMECKFCQNWEISQYRPEQVAARRVSPEQCHALASADGAPFIAYTYTEPVIFYEYMLDTARLGARTGVRSVVVSNGYIEEKPLLELLPHITAYKVDLKAFGNRFYEELCAARLQPVLHSLQIIKKAGVWLEIVVLVLPGHNDDEREVAQLARFVRRNLGRETPLHFTRFHPTYRMKNLPPTPVATLERCYDVARAEGLDFVYMGNVRGHPGENTSCPGCRALLIRRTGFSVVENNLVAGHCPRCQRAIPGVWT
ncbi:MAG: AmmeMemoRadiSam system radical SAM enzyme [Pseudomonadota bacterium]